jgi:glycosyltransferase involved in cell wall biosynthesis
MGLSIGSRPRALPAVSVTHQRRIIVFPAWFENNPYLNLHYLVARSRGYDLLLASRLGPFYDHLGGARAGDVVHVHWTAPIVQYAPDIHDARRRLALFQSRLLGARRRGIRLLWTVHNKMPHDCPYPEVEAELLTFLAENADLVIAINPLTREVLADVVNLDPERLCFLKHPTYRGLYADSISPVEARGALGLSAGQRGVLFFGQMRRYKGLEAFFDAMSEVHRLDPSTVMLLAGKTSDSDLEWVEQKMPASVPVIRDHRFVPDDEVQIWMRAASTVVLPFQNVLNSGSVFLCAAFGRSVVIPRRPHLEAEFGHEPWVRYVDPSDEVDGLVRAILAALERPDSEDVAATAFASGRSAYRMSVEFDEILRRLE